MTHAFDGDYWAAHWRDDEPGGHPAVPPNPQLVDEVSGLAPGTALDAGCGAGAEAVWLAGQGWQVTGVDISAEVSARAAGRAGPSEQVRWVCADLSVWTPDDPFDLVTTHYAHSVLPQLEFYRRLSTWVAPGGTLLIVGHLDRPDGGHAHDGGSGHDHAHGGGSLHGGGKDRSHRHAHGGGHERTGTPGEAGPPAEASVTAAATAAVLDPARWDVVTADERVRTVAVGGGAPRELHDVVVRATRRR